MRTDIPDFDAKKFVKALVKLGFSDANGGNHQYKFKHPTKTPTDGARPFFVFPHDIKRDKHFQKALVKTLIVTWGFSEDEVFEALGKKH